MSYLFSFFQLSFLRKTIGETSVIKLSHLSLILRTVASIKISKVCTRYIPTDNFPLCMVLIIPHKRLNLSSSSSSYIYIYCITFFGEL